MSLQEEKQPVAVHAVGSGRCGLCLQERVLTSGFPNLPAEVGDEQSRRLGSHVPHVCWTTIKARGLEDDGTALAKTDKLR